MMCFEIEMDSINAKDFKRAQTSSEQIFPPQMSRDEIGLTLAREELR
ncbi:hypothetical protein GH810_06695 [Acetobacterium paludosum]|uniref:Uncharacterized protein n=1 Tax=Acetobacterium paludosum TaxID=52693 RepID=A0A923HWN6_9FIRM|nr:hypothetical protein [Acetobacterium paludosum]MBC3887994.1 hypothetical protein [Acetobacterium paludosum]